MIQIAVKALLSGTLLVLAVICVWEICRLWFDRTLVLAPFDYLESGKPSAETGEQFARMVQVDMVRLAGLYGVGESASAAAVPSTDQIGRAESVEIPAVFNSDFDSIEFKAYGIDLGSLFKSLRRFIETPGEISGSVTVQNNLYTVFAELKGAGRRGEPPQRWNVLDAANISEATQSVACRIFRTLASDRTSTSNDAALFRQVGDEDFCLFNRGLAAYDQYRTRAASSPTEAAKFLDAAGAVAANLAPRDIAFPYVYKFAAIVFFEQGKFDDAQNANDRYLAWVSKSGRVDDRAKELRQTIKDKQMPVVAVAAGPRSRIRPLRPGTSAGMIDTPAAGMICCLVNDPNGALFLLSADHVFGRGVGQKIVQPASADGGKVADVVAEVTQVGDTVTLARILDPNNVRAEILNYGKIAGIATAVEVDQPVVTYRRSGEKQDGVIRSIGSAVSISTGSATDSKKALQNVIITSNISGPGDSGAAVLTADGKLIGMIYAGSQSTTVVIPIGPILKDLNVTLVQ